MSSLSRRQFEELMLKLLLMQHNDDDIKAIIDISNQNYYSYNYETFHYFTKNIQPYCEKNIHKLLQSMQSCELKMEFKTFFLTKYNDVLFNELTKEIQEALDKQSSIPEDYLLTYLTLIDYSIDYEKNNMHSDLKPIWDLLSKDIKEIDERSIILFLNEIFIKSSNKHKELFIIKILKFIEEYKDKGDRILQLLKAENQMNGIPGVKFPPCETQAFYLDYKHNKAEAEGWEVVTNNMTLYELLIQIMIAWNINIDLYDIIYYIEDSNDSQIIEHSKVDYCTPLTEVFQINSTSAVVTILIDFKPQIQQQAFTDESLYFSTEYCIKPEIQTLLKQLFKRNKSLHPLSLYSFLNNTQLNDSINTVFNKKLIIEHESMLSHLNKKTSECYLLFHLLIGFRNKDINKPYLRNIFPEDMICLGIEKSKSNFEIVAKPLLEQTQNIKEEKNENGFLEISSFLD